MHIHGTKAILLKLQVLIPKYKGWAEVALMLYQSKSFHLFLCMSKPVSDT